MEETRQALIAELGAATRDYQRVTDAVDEAVADRFGVNRTDLRCIDLLFDGPLSAGRLAEQAGLSPAATTALTDRLEAKGYVRRVRDPADRRRVLVELTDLARVRAGQAYGPLAAEGEAHLGGYTDEQLLLLRDYLRHGRDLSERHLARLREQPPDQG